MRRVAILLVLGLASFAASNMIAQQQPAKPGPPHAEAKKLLNEVWRNVDRDKPAKDVIAALDTLEQLQQHMTSGNTGGSMLMSGLNHRDPEVRKHAVRTMAYLVANPMNSAPTVAERLMRSLDDRDDVRAECFFALAQLGPHAKPAIPRAIKEMKNDDPRVRRGAIVLLGNLAREDKELIPHVITALDDPDIEWEKERGHNSVSILAMMRLERCKSNAKAAVPKLVEFLVKKKNDDFFQGTAMRTLIAIDPEHPLPLTTAKEYLKQKGSPAELQRGALTLNFLGPYAKPAIPDLVSVLKMPPLANAKHERQLKAAVLSAFGAMGPTAKEVLPLLRSMLETQDSNLRAYLNQAIENIERTK